MDNHLDELEIQVTNNKNEKLKKLARMIGMKTMPVDIKTFITDPYYLGDFAGKTVRKCWVDALEDLFPDPLTTRTYVVARGGIGCISGDTRIRLINGTISTIKELYDKYPNGGFYVYSWDISSNYWKPGFVSGVYNTGIKKVCRVTYSDVKNNVHTVITTLDHKFLTTSNEYIEARELKPNDRIQSLYINLDKSEYYDHKVASVEILDEPINVYDMTVDTYHNYGICDLDDNLIFTHNTGKSFFSKFILSYDLYKITCMEDFFRFAGLLGDKPIWIKIFNTTKWNAGNMVEEFRDWVWGGHVPYFEDELKDKSSILHKVWLGPASSTNDIISGDVLSVLLSEFNFVGADYAHQILSACKSRVTSRFRKFKDLFSHIILDSSDTVVGSPTDKFIQSDPDAANAKIYRYAIWDATPELYFHKGTFEVYAGDSEVEAHVIRNGEDTSRLDKDRILTVPEEERSNFETNVELALQEKAGIGLISGNRFLNPSNVDPHLKIQPLIDDVIKVDFYDKDDVLINYLAPAIDNLPKDRYLFIGIDMGIKKDKCGFSIGYVDEMKSRDYNGLEIIEAYYKVPIAFAISRYSGQETSISKIRDLILSIHGVRPIKAVSTDQYQSTQLNQELALAGIPIRRISTDRDNKAVITFKNLLYSGRITLPNSPLLRQEMINLINVGDKVDHPSVNPDGSEGTKDIFDSVVRTIIMMSEAGNEALDVPIENTHIIATQYDEMLDNLLDASNKARALYASMSMIR